MVWWRCGACRATGGVGIVGAGQWRGGVRWQGGGKEVARRWQGGGKEVRRGRGEVICDRQGVNGDREAGDNCEQLGGNAWQCMVEEHCPEASKILL